MRRSWFAVLGAAIAWAAIGSRAALAAGAEPGVAPGTAPAAAREPGKAASRDPRWAQPIAGKRGLANLYAVCPTLYRGAQPTPAGFRTLAEMGVKTVIDLRAFHDDRDEMARAGVKLNYVHIPFKPWHPTDEETIAFLRAVSDPGSQPVFVHCEHGADRTGTMVAIYRVVAEGWKPEDALAEMTEGGYGFHRVWEDLRRYLRAVDGERLRRTAASPGEESR